VSACHHKHARASYLCTLALVGGVSANDVDVADYTVVGGQIPSPLTAATPDPRRGREIVLDIRRGNCLICHKVPDEAEQRFQGDLGPDLTGIALRLSAGQMRMRLVDGTKINPNTVMPAYHRVDGLNRVAEAYRGQPALTALEIEDVIAYLRTLGDR
jgi:sulfur-oxidizing protein SoxX